MWGYGEYKDEEEQMKHPFYLKGLLGINVFGDE